MNALKPWKSSGDRTMEIYQDFKEIVAGLNEHKVEYLIVGAHAPFICCGSQFIDKNSATGRHRDLADFESITKKRGEAFAN